MESTETIVVEPEDRVEAKSAELVTMSRAMALRAQAWPMIASPEERSYAIEFIAEVKERLKGATEIKDFFVKPVVDLANRYRARFAPAIADYESAEKSAKARIAEYDIRVRQEKERAEREAIEKARTEERKREAEAKALEEAGRVEAAIALRSIPVIPVVIPPAPAGPKDGTSTRVKYIPQVVDEEKVPRRFLTVDIVTLGQFAARYKGQEPPPIEGVRWVARPIVTVRSR